MRRPLCGTLAEKKALEVHKGLRALLPIALCFIALLPNAAYASSVFIAEVTADSLNVRDQPGANGKIISSLKKGEKIVASPVYRGWVMVLVNGKTPGYVSSKYINIIKLVSSGDSASFYGDEEEMKCNAYSASLNLSITDVKFKCKEDLFGEGYKSCSAWFDVSINSDCDESMTANVDCEAEFKYETKDGFMPSRASESNSDSIYLSYGHGSGQIEVYWRPRVILDNVIKVKLNDSSCSISSVYDY